jgi:hypothetical protein
MGSLQQRYQDIKNRYDRLSAFDLESLSQQIRDYTNSPSNERGNSLQQAASNLTNYSTDLTTISKDLRKLLQDSGQVIEVGSGSGTGEAEERYNQRQHPEQSMEAREVGGSFVPQLRLTTIPALVSIATFMAAFSIFLIFQLLGFRSSLSLPPALTAVSAPEPGALPFYKNPMILAGVILVLAIGAITFGILYYQSWKKQQPS